MTSENLTKSHNQKLEESFDRRGKITRQRPATTSGNETGVVKSAGGLFRDEESFESRDISIVYPSTAPELRRSVDIVVADVHNENKRSEPNLRSEKLSKNVRYERRQSHERDEERVKNFDKVNAWEVEESVDVIKEIKDSNEILEINSVNNSELSNSTESYGDREIFTSEEKFIQSSAENSAAEMETADNNKIFAEPKRRRKRWSKNENNLQLTQELLAQSSDTNYSGQSESHFSNGRRSKPVPAPRRKGISKSFDYESTLAFDNGAFRSDPEEVLRIETEVYAPQGTSDDSQNYRQSTKIEMTNIYNSHKKDYGGRSKMETLPDTSDELGTEIRKIKADGVSLTPNKSEDQSVTENSLLSEDDRVSRSNESDRKIQREKSSRKDRRHVKAESTSFDTDISDLPRNEARRDYSKKSKSRKRGDTGFGEPEIRSRRSKRGVKNRQGNKSSAENSRDLNLIEYNVDESEKFISVTIHKSDVLETDFVTRHPMVKVHIVDTKTGNYLKILNVDDRGRCGYLQPMITSKFDFKENRSIVPNWEEELIFDYNFDEIIQTQQILIFFEILDLLNFAEASFNYNFLGNEGCWHKIAWAFLRPVGVDGTLHINKKLRLQLYEPPKASKKSGRYGKCEVLNWWRSTSKEKYPSTLYVTVRSVDPPIEEPLIYEHLSFNHLTEMEDESRGSWKKSSELLQLPKWDRLAAQSCKIPNSRLFQTEVFDNGSFYLAFSNNGKYLACIGSEESNYPIVVYTIADEKIFVQFMGHKNFVYSLNWSNDDKYLLSVSSDQTARIWDVGNRIIQHIDMLPHPSYVYCGKYNPGNKNVVVTGCYDCVLRVWTKSKSSKLHELSQELYEHKGYVNSLCFQKDGGLITADSLGVIILWTLKKRGGTSRARDWHLSEIIKNNEIENVVINTIILHPLGSRLLVHSRDNGLRIIDLATGVVLQRYKGLRNRRLQTTACLSPCGGLILCGGEDSYLIIWSLESGKLLARYFVREAKIISCVAYHPFDHIMAFSTFGNISAVQVLKFDKNSTGESMGLDLTVNNDLAENADDFEITMKFDKTDLVSRDDKRNSRGKYSLRNTENLSKNSKELETEVKGRDRKVPVDLTEDTINEKSVTRQELLKLKIQRHNECQAGLKSRSAARLNNIIEKIDKILVNTTSKRDLDSTCSSNNTRRLEVEQLASNSKNDTIVNRGVEVRSKSAISRRKNSCTPNTEVTTEASNTSREFIEMQDIVSRHNETSENDELSNSNRRFPRLKNRASTRTEISQHSEAESESEERSIFTNNGKLRVSRSSCNENEFSEANNSDVESNRRRKSKGMKTKKLLSGSSTEKKIKSTSDNDTCVIVLEDRKDDTQSDPSTVDSAGTYTVRKDKSVEPLASDISKASGTSGSVKSGATFTVENEISSKSKAKFRLSKK